MCNAFDLNTAFCVEINVRNAQNKAEIVTLNALTEEKHLLSIAKLRQKDFVQDAHPDLKAKQEVENKANAPSPDGHIVSQAIAKDNDLPEQRDTGYLRWAREDEFM